MGGLFDKSIDMPQTPAAPPPTSGVEEMMSGYMEMMSQTISQITQMQSQMIAQMPQTPQLPPIYEPPEVDWSETRDKLKQKMKADYALERARKSTRNPNIFTSPLLDDEQADTTSSSLLEKKDG